jgi:molybdopterin-containing oxidoreductase family iron-sulfur binding subunit
MEANDTMNTGPAHEGQTAHAELKQAAEAHLTGKRGKRYWRSLEELSDTPEFQKFLDDEFPNRSSLANMNRRDLLKFMGASIALAGLSGCRSVFMPQDKVVPYVKQPEEIVPGKPLFYASAVTLGGYATGVLVEQHEGRPIRLEGNPAHPATGRGALDSISQAEILGFYDPDRVGNVLNRANLGPDYTSDVSTWEMFFSVSREIFRRQRAAQGAGIRILTGSITSPTLVAQITRLLTRYPQARWHAYEPAGRANVHGGARMAFGRPLDPVYDFSQAQVVLSLDSDFFSPTATPGSLRYAHDFSERRRVKGVRGEMNRLYAIESTPGLVGAMADHRWPVRASQVYAQTLAIAAALGVPGVTAAEGTIPQNELQAVVRDLQANAGRSLVVAGEHQPIEVQALVHGINEVLGNVGKTVRYIEPVDATADVSRVADLGALVQDLQTGNVELLLILEGNPVYDAPADLKFTDALLKAKTKVHIGLYEDETSSWCDWHLPLAHTLEIWGDARAFDGTLSVIQPIIAPLYESKAASEIFSQLLDTPRPGYDLVRDQWKSAGVVKGDFEKGWRQVVHDGMLANSARAAVPATVNLGGVSLPAPAAAGEFEIAFLPDPTIYDGRFANNGWLQELPKPLTKLTWDNVALMSPATARKVGAEADSLVTLTLPNGRTKEAPVFILPGQPEGQVTVHLGYGRTKGGVVATAVVSENDNTGRTVENGLVQQGGTGGGGFDAYALRSAGAPYFEGGLQITANRGSIYHLATTQGHQPINGDTVAQFEGDHREVVVEHDLATFNQEAAKIKEERDHHYTKHNKQNLYPEEIFVYNGPQWGMTIDLNTCIGCNACVTACQSENNIPVVGKEQVLRHREMHWMRIDRYYSSMDGEESPTVSWQPVACVHCEKAPCEPVCPVAATVHSHEGLNQMIYNRCVGTRYCSNNCPYKVRRFNYLNYTDNQKQFDPVQDEKPRIPLLRMLNNPNVTVRGRGIMEKCTYCVQRINHARIEAKKQNREIEDGEIVTACQQACPTKTIVFGNVEDRESAVYQWRNDPRAYLLLQELQTRPRTSHLAKLRNPNPEIKPAEAVAGGAH